MKHLFEKKNDQDSKLIPIIFDSDALNYKVQSRGTA
jgi:hypothetical protein